MPITLKVDTSDLDRIADNVAYAAKGVPLHIRKEIPRLTDKVLTETRIEVPKDTRRLERSLHRTLEDGGATGVIREGERHGLFVRKGTRPHIILPRFKQALFWEGAPHPVKRVQHPGTQPNPYHERAVAKSRDELEASGLDIVVKIAGDVTRG